MPELRQNIITGDWVVIAPERSKRPNEFVSAEVIKGDKSDCPFCLSGSSYKVRLPHYENSRVYTFPNKYPAFLEDPSRTSKRSRKVEDDFYTVRPSLGGHDVLAIKDHDTDIYKFDNDTWADLFLLAKRRYHYWKRDRNTEYSMLIYNHGVAAGASITHPHAQIFSSNIVPNHIGKEIVGAERYYASNGACVFCDLIRHERKARVRLIEETEDYVAFTFYAARFPFEIWVMPKKHMTHFEEETEATLTGLATITQKVVAKLGTLLKEPALNFFVHDAPTNVGRDNAFHWHLEIAPRLGTYGGFELGAGTVIDVIAPEDAAEFIRSV